MYFEYFLSIAYFASYLVYLLRGWNEQLTENGSTVSLSRMRRGRNLAVFVQQASFGGFLYHRFPNSKQVKTITK